MSDLDVALHIKQEFERRKNQNPRYSLRQFSSSLGVHSSFLSRLMKGERSISLQRARELLTKIKLREDQVSDVHFVPIQEETFKHLSQWYAYAILELTHIKGFKWSSIWISRRLGLSVLLVSECMKELVTLGVIQKKTTKANMVVIQTPELSNAHQKISTASMRAHQKQILLGAIEAMDTISINNRDQTSMTLAFPSHKIEEASKLLTTFRRDFLKKVKTWGEANSVYQLSLSFYPVTKLTEND